MSLFKKIKCDSILLEGSTSGNTVIMPSATTINHTITLPGNLATVTGDVLSSTDAGILSWITPAGGGGETNTASNQGTTTYGLYKTKSGVDLEFKSLTTTSTKIILTSNTDDVGINVDDTKIDHDTLLNYNISQHRIIDDVTASTTSLYSSNKIDTDIASLRSDVYGIPYIGNKKLDYGVNMLSSNNNEKNIPITPGAFATSVKTGSTSGDVFTTSGLITKIFRGYGIFSYISTNIYEGAWSNIVNNNTTTITVNAGGLFPGANRVYISSYNPVFRLIPTGIEINQINFSDAIFDGTHIYLCPQAYADIIKINLITNEQTSITGGGNYYASGCLVNGVIYFKSKTNNQMLILNTDTGGTDVISLSSMSATSIAVGVVNAGNYLYIMPGGEESNNTCRYSLIDGSQTTISTPSTSGGGTRFHGCTYNPVDKKIYLAATHSTDFVRLDLDSFTYETFSTGTATNISVGCLWNPLDKKIYYAAISNTSANSQMDIYDSNTNTFTKTAAMATEYIGGFNFGVAQYGEMIVLSSQSGAFINFYDTRTDTWIHIPHGQKRSGASTIFQGVVATNDFIIFVPAAGKNVMLVIPPGMPSPANFSSLGDADIGGDLTITGNIDIINTNSTTTLHNISDSTTELCRSRTTGGNSIIRICPVPSSSGFDSTVDFFKDVASNVNSIDLYDNADIKISMKPKSDSYILNNLAIGQTSAFYPLDVLGKVALDGIISNNQTTTMNPAYTAASITLSENNMKIVAAASTALRNTISNQNITESSEIVYELYVESNTSDVLTFGITSQLTLATNANIQTSGPYNFMYNSAGYGIQNTNQNSGYSTFGTGDTMKLHITNGNGNFYKNGILEISYTLTAATYVFAVGDPNSASSSFTCRIISPFEIKGKIQSTSDISCNDVICKKIIVNGATSGKIELQAATTTTDHKLILPSSLATVTGDVLSSTDAGILSWITPSGGGGGETNTASNQGTTTYGLYKTKSGVDLEFKSLTATSTKIILTSNTDDVGINVDDTKIDHDTLLNYDISQHRIINDVTASTTSLYSSNKVNTDIDQLRSDVYGIPYIGEKVRNYGNSCYSQNMNEKTLPTMPSTFSASSNTGTSGNNGILDVFTLSSGSFSVHRLKGYACYSYINTNIGLGTWAKIISNTTSTLLLADGELFTSANRVWISPFMPIYKLIPNPVQQNLPNYGDGIWDGTYLYLMNASAPDIVKINIVTGGTTVITAGSNLYFSGCIGPNNVIYAPSQATDEMLIYDPNTDTAEVVTLSSRVSGNADRCRGAIHVGEYIYILPLDSTNATFIKYHISTRTDTAISITSVISGSLKFDTGCYSPVDHKIYLASNGTTNFYRLNLSTDILEVFQTGQAQSTRGCCYHPLTRKIYYTAKNTNTNNNRIQIYCPQGDALSDSATIPTEFLGWSVGLAIHGETLMTAGYSSNFHGIYDIQSDTWKFFPHGLRRSSINFTAVVDCGEFMAFIPANASSVMIMVPPGNPIPNFSSIGNVDFGGDLTITGNIDIISTNSTTTLHNISDSATELCRSRTTGGDSIIRICPVPSSSGFNSTVDFFKDVASSINSFDIYDGSDAKISIKPKSDSYIGRTSDTLQLGINNTTPSEALDVVGNVVVDGTFNLVNGAESSILQLNASVLGISATTAANAEIDIDPICGSTNTGHVNLFKAVSTTAANSALNIYKTNGSGIIQHSLGAASNSYMCANTGTLNIGSNAVASTMLEVQGTFRSSGNSTIHGTLQVDDDVLLFGPSIYGTITLSASTLKITATTTGDTNIEIDPICGAASNSNVNLFKAVSTTDVESALNIYKTNGAGDLIQHSLKASSNSYICAQTGNLNIGSNAAATTKLGVVGTFKATGAAQIDGALTLNSSIILNNSNTTTISRASGGINNSIILPALAAAYDQTIVFTDSGGNTIYKSIYTPYAFAGTHHLTDTNAMLLERTGAMTADHFYTFGNATYGINYTASADVNAVEQNITRQSTGFYWKILESGYYEINIEISDFDTGHTGLLYIGHSYSATVPNASLNNVSCVLDQALQILSPPQSRDIAFTNVFSAAADSYVMAGIFSKSTTGSITLSFRNIAVKLRKIR